MSDYHTWREIQRLHTTIYTINFLNWDSNIHIFTFYTYTIPIHYTKTILVLAPMNLKVSLLVPIKQLVERLFNFQFFMFFFPFVYR